MSVRRPIEVSANEFEGPGGLHPARDQGRQGRQKPKISRPWWSSADQRGHAGFGMGKAREVPMAIRKAIEQAKKNLLALNLKGTSIPHQVVGHYGSGQVLLKPASEGTGIIAGGPVRAVMKVAVHQQRAHQVSGHLESAQRD